MSVLLKLQEWGVPERIGWPGSLQSRNTVSPVPHVSQQKKKKHAADRVSGPVAQLPATMESDEVSCGRMPTPEVFIGACTWKGLPCAGGGRWWAIYSNITRHLLPHAKLFSSCSMKCECSWTLLSEVFQPQERNLSLLLLLVLRSAVLTQVSC